MAWTTQPTFVAGNILTAAQLNAALRDDSNFLFSPPMCRAYNSANISVATSGTWQSLTLDSERFDTDSMHSTSSNTSRITATTAGKYIFGGGAQFAANGTGIRGFRLLVNAVTNPPLAMCPWGAGDGANGNPGNVTTEYSLAATDYVELSVVQTSGGALNVNAAAANAIGPEFWAAWQGN